MRLILTFLLSAIFTMGIATAPAAQRPAAQLQKGGLVFCHAGLFLPLNDGARIPRS
jgi:hypothetical protein